MRNSDKLQSHQTGQIFRMHNIYIFIGIAKRTDRVCNVRSMREHYCIARGTSVWLRECTKKRLQQREHDEAYCVEGCASDAARDACDACERNYICLPVSVDTLFDCYRHGAVNRHSNRTLDMHHTTSSTRRNEQPVLEHASPRSSDVTNVQM